MLAVKIDRRTFLATGAAAAIAPALPGRSALAQELFDAEALASYPRSLPAQIVSLNGWASVRAAGFTVTQGYMDRQVLRFGPDLAAKLMAGVPVDG